MSLVPNSIMNMVICVLLMFLFNPTSCCAYGVGDITGKALFVFGDSLFDAGNNQYYTPGLFIPANHYPYGMSTDSATGRHSDGLLVPDFIAHYAGLDLIPAYLCPDTANETFGYNFASAGAGCLDNHTNAMNLGEQLLAFKNETQKLKDSLGANEAKNLIRNAVYLISMGGNDYLSHVSDHKNDTEAQMKAYVAMVIGNLTMAIKGIYKEGGRKFAFQDVGPIGCLPTLKYFSKLIEGCYEYALKIVKIHNSALRDALETMKLSSDYTDIKYGVFDYYNQLRNRILHPGSYGFKTSEIACCGYGGYINGLDCGMETGFFLCTNPSSSVMFDGAHTTQRTNSQLAQLMWSGNQSVIAPYNVEQLFQEDGESALEIV